jgi:hypothetical protein
MKQFWPKRTLLTVLVVILCATVIVAVFLPVQAGSPRTSTSGCISNLKQLGTSQAVYAADFDDCLPPHFTMNGGRSKFVQSLRSYIRRKNILVCPDSAVSKRDYENRSLHLTYDHFPALARFMPWNSVIQVSIVPNPAEVLQMRDEVLNFEARPKGNHVITNHGEYPDQLTVLFIDLHAKRLSTLPGEDQPFVSLDGLLVK